MKIVTGDARKTGIPGESVDLVVTSPPYWMKRDYDHPDQIGREDTPGGYVAAILDCLREWRRVLKPSGSVFLNIGDTYFRKSLAGIPGRVEAAAADDGWLVRNRIVWAKDGGVPEPVRDRLASRHEYLIHLTGRSSYYYDLLGYAEYSGGTGANPGDVWQISRERNTGGHLAPFPEELVRRAVLLACPAEVCGTCGEPRRRIVRRTAELDMSRPQAQRAVELAAQAGLTPAHIQAIQATGISDAGKALRFQSGTGRNSSEVRILAQEAKSALGGYFREFTFARKETAGWTDCGHGAWARATVLDPFAGTGTTVRVAVGLGRNAIGVDLVPHPQKD